jgi:hypothetical protein
MGPKILLYTSLKIYLFYWININFYSAGILQVYLILFLSFPDSISLVFRFLVLGIVKGVFLNGVFPFRIEGSSLLSSILLILYLDWYSDFCYPSGVLGSAYSPSLPGSSYPIIPVLLVLLVVFLSGFIESVLFLSAGSDWVKAEIIIGVYSSGLSRKAGKGSLL